VARRRRTSARPARRSPQLWPCPRPTAWSLHAGCTGEFVRRLSPTHATTRCKIAVMQLVPTTNSRSSIEPEVLPQPRPVRTSPLHRPLPRTEPTGRNSSSVESCVAAGAGRASPRPRGVACDRQPRTAACRVQHACQQLDERTNKTCWTRTSWCGRCSRSASTCSLSSRRPSRQSARISVVLRNDNRWSTQCVLDQQSVASNVSPTAHTRWRGTNCLPNCEPARDRRRPSPLVRPN